MEAKKLDIQTEKWKKEIDALIEHAASNEERTSLKHFRAAILPLLQDPDRLRTLLGKIAQLL